MKTENLKQFAATKLRGNFDQVQATFREFEQTKEKVRRKAVLPPGNETDLPLCVLAYRAGIAEDQIYSASHARFTTNCVILILTDGSQRNVEGW